jgi:subtilisin family serine protease
MVPRATAGCLTALLAVLVAASVPGRGPATARVSVGYATDRALARAVTTSGAAVVRNLKPLGVAELDVRDIESIRTRPGIRFVERARERTSVAEPALSIASVASSVPEWQYNVTRVDAVPASVLRAASSVQLAVIDTGADVTAPDIAAKSPRTYNTRTGTTDVRDTNGHGTFVASLAAGSVTNDDGISGAGGDVQLMVVKSGSASGAFTDVDEAAAIMYAVDHGARILNLSVGGPSTSSTGRRAISYAVRRGALLVAAVGNEHERGDPIEYPAALLQPVGTNGVGGSGLAVTASTTSGGRASFANTGSWVSLAAPGENVFGAVSPLSSPSLYPRTLLTGAKSGLYGYGSGTSFAAPQVAGAAALVWAANPALTAQQVALILKETADGAGRWTPDLGFGVVDVAAAVARAQAGGPSVLLSGKRDKRKLTLTWGGGAAAYTLSLSTDAKPPRVLLPSTTRTTTTLTLAPGHLYAFTVSALDPAGIAKAMSAALTVAS